MSRTRATQTTESPVKGTIFYNGQKGGFGKISDVEGGGIEDISLPLYFIVLDNSTFRVTGKKGLEKDAPRYRSTLAHESRKKTLRVWYSGNSEKVLAEGTWGSISEKLQGARFTRCIYAMCNIGGENAIWCIQLHGRALFTWMDYLKKNALDPCSDIAFSIKSTVEMVGKIGTPSLVPVFSHSKINADTVKKATEADEVLQSWLDDVFENGGKDGSEEASEDETPSAPAPANDPTRQPSSIEQDHSFPTQDVTSYEDDSLPF